MKILFCLATLFATPTFANVLGDMQTFSPNTDGLDFITVHTARPLPKGFFAFSNYLNYAKDNLLVYKTLAQQDRMDYKDSLFEYDFGVAYGLTEKIQVSLQAPVLINHSSDPQDGVDVNITTGIHSFRPGIKWTLDDVKDPHWALLASVDFTNVKNSPYTGTDPRPIVNLESAYRWKNKGWVQAVNAGVRLRDPSSTPSDAHMYPLRSQFTASYGLSNDFSKTARWVFEAFGSYPLDKTPYNEAMDPSSLELLLALKHRWYRNLNFDWGFTVEPGVKTISPAWRVFAGLIYYWKPASTSKEPSISTASAMTLPFAVLPENPTVNVSDTVQFYADGNDVIDSCRVTDGPGSINAGCEYLAEAPGWATVEFRNAKGEVRTTSVQVKQAQAAQPLAFTQKVWEVYVGSTIQLKVKGGTPLYHYRIDSGEGEISDQGIYQAPLRVQNVRVTVIDEYQKTAQTLIRVIESPKADKEINLTNLEFISGKAELTPSAEKYFNANIGQLRGVSVQKILVEGHTDSIGSDDYNLRLSRQRAQAIRQRIIKALGYSPETVEGIGFGEARPIATNETPQGRQRNRRVILKVYYKK